MTNFSNEYDNSATELDFEKHWTSLTIQQEVFRGVELREQKPKPNDNKWDFVNLSLPSCSKSANGTPPRRFKARKVTKKSRLKQLSKDRLCPLRVVELAEPSKRHCLNTWKNNYQTLPDYMVERLRKHVMDEKPVVRISEAVNYFKNRKTTKKSLTTHTKQKSKKNRDLNMILCSLFAYKIKQKLLKPVNVLLNEELASIYYVVIDELNSILRNKKKDRSSFCKNNKILDEMAKKVTLWITNILEETSYKQLLEQLEELEEEEGPVLDILDELLENVKSICMKEESSDSSISNDISSNSASLSIKNIDDDNGSVLEDNFDETNNYDVHKDVNTILSDEEINNENYESLAVNQQSGMEAQIKSLLDERINYIIDNFGNTEVVSNNNNIIASEKNIEIFSEPNVSHKASDINHTTGAKSDLILNTDHNYIDTKQILMSEPEKNEFTSNNSPEASVQDIHEKNDIKINSVAVDVDKTKNLSVEDLDEETKKVKFSNIDMGNGENGTEIKKYSSELTNDYKEPVVNKSSKDYILSHFNVAPPNPNLLSYIDEVWPEYILPPLLKATESVNKSVTSLGNIIEADENIIQSANKKIPMKNIKPVFIGPINLTATNLTDEGASAMINNKRNIEKQDIENVNKSITSLGRIMEADENIIQSPNQKIPMKNIKPVFNDRINLTGTNLTAKEASGIINKNMNIEKPDNENVKKSTTLGRVMEADENIIQSPNKNISMKNVETVYERINSIATNLTDEATNARINKYKNVEKPGNEVTSHRELVKDGQRDDRTSAAQMSVHVPINKGTSEKVHKTDDLKILSPNIRNKETTKKLKDPQTTLETSNIKDQRIADQFARNNFQARDNFPSQNMVHIWKNQILLKSGDVERNKSEISVQQQKRYRPLMNKYTNKIEGDFKNPVINTNMQTNKKVQTSFVPIFKNDEFYKDTKENIQKWCMGLQNVTENLEMWTEWIQNVCLHVLNLKYEGMSFQTGTLQWRHMKRWIKLKDNIDRDAELWLQLRTRLRHGLRTYQISYHENTINQKTTHKCKCNNGSQNNPLRSQSIFENNSKSTRRI